LASQATGAVPISPTQVRTWVVSQACIACWNELLYVVGCVMHNCLGNVLGDCLVHGALIVLCPNQFVEAVY